MSSVYLAGPIAHLTYEEATEWRTSAARVLESYGIQVFSPMRAKEFLKGRGVITPEIYADVLASDAGIVTRDRNDVRTCDLVLANLLGAPQVSVGTPVEFGWADAFGKPIITVMEAEGNAYEHPFTRRLSGFRVTSLDEALEIAVAVLTT